MALPLLLERGIPGAHIAVGNLSGVAPADIRTHLLIRTCGADSVLQGGEEVNTVAHDGTVKLTGNACAAHAGMILADMAALIARRAYEAHECGGPEAEGAEP